MYYTVYVFYLNTLVWRKLQVSWCYCVKYIRISLFWIIYISQGSVATYVRCGGQRDKDFIAQFLLNIAMTEF